MSKSLMQKMCEVAPSVAFAIEVESDDCQQWDGDAGDGPNLAEDGYTAFQSYVQASVIVNGVLVTGHSYLGGSWYKTPAEVVDAEISGYLPQMLEEAVHDLAAQLKFGEAPDDLTTAARFLKRELKRRYDEQMSQPVTGDVD